MREEDFCLNGQDARAREKLFGRLNRKLLAP
jgi:hypothetical protein